MKLAYTIIMMSFVLSVSAHARETVGPVPADCPLRNHNLSVSQNTNKDVALAKKLSSTSGENVQEAKLNATDARK